MEKKNVIREKNKEISKKTKIINTIEVGLLGLFLGIFAKTIDLMAINELPEFFEKLDIPNFLGRFAIWITIALYISLFSNSPKRASLNVFVFFATMVWGYYFTYYYADRVFPKSYALIWFAFVALSPALAYLTWYAGGDSKISLLLSIGIVAVVFSFTFAFGWLYLDVISPLELVSFIACLVAVKRKTLKDNVIMVVSGIGIAFIIRLLFLYVVY